mmetsp:Transcript_4291/g.17407  ORF Transcript_4291/g.17407 Transcript_4291/m.17407 type:complete len:487 (+) Transcript_4291:1090-2550(+)
MGRRARVFRRHLPHHARLARVGLGGDLRGTLRRHRGHALARLDQHARVGGLDVVALPEQARPQDADATTARRADVLRRRRGARVGFVADRVLERATAFRGGLCCVVEPAVLPPPRGPRRRRRLGGQGARVDRLGRARVVSVRAVDDSRDGGGGVADRRRPGRRAPQRRAPHLVVRRLDAAAAALGRRVVAPRAGHAPGPRPVEPPRPPPEGARRVQRRARQPPPRRRRLVVVVIVVGGAGKTTTTTIRGGLGASAPPWRPRLFWRRVVCVVAPASGARGVARRRPARPPGPGRTASVHQGPARARHDHQEPRHPPGDVQAQGDEVRPHAQRPLQDPRPPALARHRHRPPQPVAPAARVAPAAQLDRPREVVAREPALRDSRLLHRHRRLPLHLPLFVPDLPVHRGRAAPQLPRRRRQPLQRHRRARDRTPHRPHRPLVHHQRNRHLARLLRHLPRGPRHRRHRHRRGLRPGLTICDALALDGAISS